MTENRIAVCLLTAVLAVSGGCASGGGAGSGAGSDARREFTETRDMTRTGALSYTVEGNRAIYRLPDGSAEAAWPHLLAAWDSLGIPRAQVDAASRSVGAGAFVVSRSFAGEPANRFFGCGSTLTGPLANQARINVDLVTTLSDADGGVTVETRLEAVATPFSGSRAPRRCTSTYTLEERIARLVQDGLAGS